MNEVNVLVVPRAGLYYDGCLEEIALVDPRVSVQDGTEQFLDDLHRKGTKGPLVERLKKELALDKERPVCQSRENLDTLLSRAEVIFGRLLFPEDLVLRAPRLKWLHIGAIGLDRYMPTGMLDAGVVITNSRGAISTPVAEHAMALAFMLARNARLLLDNARRRLWERSVSLELYGKTIAIIGLGSIGGEVARLARGIGMNVLATRRSATGRESGVLGIDKLYPRQDLVQMLSEADFVVVAVPLTPETKEMIGENELRAMKPTAYIINVARGQIISEFALIRALKEGWIAGAGLDVFEREPLPSESELWDLPNIIISPHTAAFTDRRKQRTAALFRENLKRYLAGDPLLNQVSADKGY